MGFWWRHDNRLSPRSDRARRRSAGPCLLAALSLSGSGCELLIGHIPEDRSQADAQVDAKTEQTTQDSGSPLVPPTSPEFPGDAYVSPARDAGAPADDGAMTDSQDAGDEPDAQLDAGDANDAGVTAADGGTPDAGDMQDAGDGVEDASSGEQDAGTPEDAGQPCTPTTWYADADGDLYGNPAQKKSSCDKPSGAWVNRAGDCADHDDLVNRGQTMYFGTPYTASNGKASFDYDCSGQEDPAAGQATAPDACLPTNLCKGSGYEKTARSGVGVNAYCGSVSIMSCSFGISLSLCTSAHTETPDPFVCR